VYGYGLSISLAFARATRMPSTPAQPEL